MPTVYFDENGNMIMKLPYIVNHDEESDASMTTKEAIKPCPFCGMDGHLIEKETNYEKSGYAVECLLCGASTRGYTEKEQAVKAWNIRIKE